MSASAIGSIVATYAMARGWIDFWLAWIAVDAVGVPLLAKSHFYPSAVLYFIYAGLIAYGFTVWLRTPRPPQTVSAPLPSPSERVDADHAEQC